MKINIVALLLALFAVAISGTSLYHTLNETSVIMMVPL